MTTTIPQPGTCPGCAALQRQLEDLREQIEALDRGLVETGTTAGRALRKASDIEAGVDEVFRMTVTAGHAAAARRPRQGRRPGGRHLTVVQP